MFGKPQYHSPNQALPLRVLVTTKLESTLRHLRQPDRARILWIDAICIDQKTPDERSSQIQLIARIYGGACCVLDWLGEKDRDIGIAFDAVERMDKIIKGHSHQGISRSTSPCSRPRSRPPSARKGKQRTCRKELLTRTSGKNGAEVCKRAFCSSNRC